MVNKHIKMFNIISIKLQIKSTMDSTTYPSEQVKLYRLIIPSIEENAEELELSYTAGWYIK